MNDLDRQSKAFQVLAQRGVWEQKERLYYLMRHDGLRRLNKPFPTAADAHFPLVDMQISELKPFWIGHAFGGERLADFVAMRTQLADMTEAAADFMDFELRYRTAFRYVMEQAVDTMLLRGRGVLKMVYDPFKQKLVFKNVDPLYVLMADQYDDFDDADYFVEVQTLTVPQYQRNRNFNQDPAVLNAIRGKTDWNLSAIKLDKMVREGVTHSSRDDLIILWNYYEREQSRWVVRTHCPLAWEQKVRAPYGLPLYWDGEPLQPFCSITMEIKDEGWYSPRGVAELNAAFEAYATKLWNEKSDAMTFANRPLFTADNELQNSGNLRFMPGELIPGNIKAVQMPAPAMSFTEEINFTREVAEQRARMPDFGILGGDQGGSRPRTATENNRIAGLQEVGADHNGDVFRSVRLAKIFKLAWALICHREDLALEEGRPKRLTYFVCDNLQTLPVQALHDQYLVVPAGTGGTKQQRLQRAIGRYTLFKGAPNVDQDGLVRDVLAADDSRLVKKLLVPTGMKAASEAEDEATEIAIMLIGFAAPALPGEDHITRIKVLVGFLQKQELTGAPVDPIAQQRIQQHLAVHFQYLQQQQPQAARQLRQAVMAMEQQAAAVRMGGAGAMPTNGAPAPGPAPAPGAPAANGGNGNGGPPGEKISINYKDAPEDIKRQMEAAAGFTPSRMTAPLEPTNGGRI